MNLIQNKKKVKISIVPLSYKSDEKLISSFLEQIYDFLKNCELVVILEPDDLKGYRLWEKQIKLFNIKNYILENLIDSKSKGECLNNAILKSCGNYIMRCDMDDYILPNRYLETIRIIEEYNVDLIYSDMIDLKKNNVISYPRPNLLSLYSSFKNPIPAPTVCFKKSFFLKKRLLFPKISRCEDLYLTLSFIDKKAIFCKLKSPVVKYNNNNFLKRDFINWIINARVRFLRKRYDFIGLISLLFGVIFLLIGVLIFFIRKFKDQ